MNAQELHALMLLTVLLGSLLTLSWLSQLVSLRVQGVIFYLTGWGDLASVTIFLTLLPGVVLHEAAHWLAARALGLRVSRFRIWPRKQGSHLGLGSVSMQRADIWRESLVGMAPLLLGNTVIAWIGWRVFATPALLEALATGHLLQAAATFWMSLRTVDGLLWAYALFAIGNSMMPSSSDREPLKPVLLYTALVALIYVGVGLPLEPLRMLLAWIEPFVEISVGALVFLILVDMFVLSGLWPLEILLRKHRGY
ncbi:hypothetical protein [Caldilinea sp.]|uniref:hypothetical protein n=1 Tax=Caldilinea sp. TaxID=2293560 RepID=UPI001B232FE1|nr:hypothetical protein [Caldilinea sp.]MBO9391403.1 hypothetical protein [Caldilinea sp.]